jgi:hypothetical protein
VNDQYQTIDAAERNTCFDNATDFDVRISQELVRTAEGNVNSADGQYFEVGLRWLLFAGPVCEAKKS